LLLLLLCKWNVLVGTKFVVYCLSMYESYVWLVDLRCPVYVLCVLYILLQLFAIIVFGCISSQGYRHDSKEDREVCLYNNDNNACNYGVGIGVIAFLASIGFLAGEYMFEQMSSVKTRKHYVLGDLGFSG